jgi:predicted hotdog family 3-hydroxylacyl-ACP dehydratase
MTVGTFDLPKDREQIAGLVPHQGAMCLLDSVLAATPDSIVCLARIDDVAGHPLARNGSLAAIALCEYGAQAMAVHGGMLARAAGAGARPGWLVALRDVRLATATVDPGELEVVARREAASDAAWQYEFEVNRSGRTLASGRATVGLQRAG